MKTFEFYRPKSWYENLPKQINDRIVLFFDIINVRAVVIDYLKNNDIKISVSNKLIPKDYLYTKIDFDELIMYRSQQPRKIIEALFIV